MKKKYFFIVASIVLMLLIITGYTTWNRLDPDFTCARCHEIADSHTSWRSSAHGGVKCVECHGTAMSNGLLSLKEKTGMVVTHFTNSKRNEDIRLDEAQLLRLVDRCVVCHQSEHAGWLAGGHAVNYREIFMDEAHNKMEKPYWDCLRCHGMFFDGNVHDLMLLEGDTPSLWTIKDKKQETRPVVPCMACHQLHADNPVSKRYVSMTDTADRSVRFPRTALYVRADQIYLRSDQLTPVAMQNAHQPVNRAIDPNTLLCQQCHAPDYVHTAGSQDDRTPTGIHEGISCTACHKGHSFDARESCLLCHSEVSKNCKLDVRTMNTSYLSKDSPHNIHQITCTSCHETK